mmetsp:Transcript_39266/g.112065  ORF Transcript_39266/g.112065 Transcript_39266/m.112065 type:complete len:241 (+) Transcript_39266:63-785(+)
MAAQLIFHENSRGMHSLCRGWRTPDPSPTRSSAGLPGCAGFGEWVAEPLEDEGQTPAGPPLRRSRAREEVGSRTPSPSPVAWRTCTSDESFPVRGAPGHILGAGNLGFGQISSASEDNDTPRAHEMKRGSPPQEPEQQQALAVLPGSWGVVFTPIHMPVACVFAPEGPFEPAVPPPPPVPQVSLPLSAGTVGHPVSCAGACKYAWKRRGCKDGVNCNRCHMCEWKKHAAKGNANHSGEDR